MRHRVVGRTLGRRSEHRLSLMYNLATEVLKHGRVTTTQAKAEEAQAVVEKIITQGKGGTLHNRRQAMAVLMDEKVVRKLFDELAPRYKERAGGYTRLLKLMTRPGDASRMAILELV